MRCTLYIPHLIPPHELAEALWHTVDAPRLKSALTRASYRRDAVIDSSALLCGLFNVAQQHDWPLAPLLAGVENLPAESGYWLCATPVHLESRRNALLLTDPAALMITATESTAFATMLGEHLREENITLHAPRPDRWFLRCDTAPVMTTASLDAVSGRDVRTFLPQGADSPRWHRILTEIQMLLHAHPLNDAREARGAAAVNSVWLWAGGELPPPAAAPFETVWSDDATVRALARHADCRGQPRPESMTPEILKTLESGSHLLSFELLASLIRRGDAQAWSSAVTALNRDWFNPLLDALQARRLSALTLITANDSGTQRFAIHRSDRFKIFNKNKYL